MKISSTIIIVFLCLVSLAHLSRLLFQVEIVANGAPIPQWVSVFGFVLPLALAIWFRRAQKG